MSIFLNQSASHTAPSSVPLCVPQGSFRTSPGSEAPLQALQPPAPLTPAPEVQRPVQATKKESKEPKKVTHSPSRAGDGCRGEETACV